MTSPDSAESLDAKAMDDRERAQQLVTAWAVASDALTERFYVGGESAARLEERIAKAFAEVRREERERCARLVELHAHGMTSGVFMRMAERIRALSPEGPPR